jgi:hypothetical protein
MTTTWITVKLELWIEDIFLSLSFQLVHVTHAGHVVLGFQKSHWDMPETRVEKSGGVRFKVP